jgi:hypothetical protein
MKNVAKVLIVKAFYSRWLKPTVIDYQILYGL